MDNDSEDSQVLRGIAWDCVGLSCCGFAGVEGVGGCCRPAIAGLKQRRKSARKRTHEDEVGESWGNGS